MTRSSFAFSTTTWTRSALNSSLIRQGQPIVASVAAASWLDRAGQFESDDARTVRGHVDEDQVALIAELRLGLDRHDHTVDRHAIEELRRDDRQVDPVRSQGEPVGRGSRDIGRQARRNVGGQGDVDRRCGVAALAQLHPIVDLSSEEAVELVGIAVRVNDREKVAAVGLGKRPEQEQRGKEVVRCVVDRGELEVSTASRRTEQVAQ